MANLELACLRLINPTSVTSKEVNSQKTSDHGTGIQNHHYCRNLEFKLHQNCVHPEQVAIVGNHSEPYGYYGSTVELPYARMPPNRLLNHKRLPQAKLIDEIQKLPAVAHQLQMANGELKIDFGRREKPFRQQMDPKKIFILLQSVSSSGRGNTQEVASGCVEDENVFKQHEFPVSMPVAKIIILCFCY